MEKRKFVRTRRGLVDQTQELSDSFQDALIAFIRRELKSGRTDNDAIEMAKRGLAMARELASSDPEFLDKRCEQALIHAKLELDRLPVESPKTGDGNKKQSLTPNVNRGKVISKSIWGK